MTAREECDQIYLSIFDLPGPNRKIILDISNICPIPIFGTQQYSRNDALIIQKAAQQRYDERMESSTQFLQLMVSSFTQLFLKSLVDYLGSTLVNYFDSH